ncbi:hypothetical protein HGRIS_014313 [Hohenbuehelia grisea]|uniref:Secreted protein n=1 Tax=Hohenbuehelia grisea TaxID=104357 RepID=A0ABR3JT02_9AGAR
MPLMPTIYQNMWIVVTMLLTNIMACRVFRKAKFGYIREAELVLSVIAFQHQSTLASTSQRTATGADSLTSRSTLTISQENKRSPCPSPRLGDKLQSVELESSV